ncbi:MAG: AAA family ATPase [Chlamydiae bacterium CG10_big_fil_rev_8_21_14_0_10_42_34]|nr:MAG: AAA family ATPase [Chlamydiae bacterium CG10_big_fil_rev_8_21_14_0_10_42_34]
MTPLSEKLRPKKLSEISGQQNHIHFVKQIVKNGHPLSLLLFGPPGCGKTTIARAYAQSFKLPFVQLSAVFNTTTELKKILKEGQENPLFHRQTILFVDEIHRFNRAQQDVFLPFLEDGTLILVGATTENPSFVINNALLSRLRVLKLEPLEPASLEQIIQRFEASEEPLNLSQDERKRLIQHAQGDARHLLNMIENIQEGLPSQKKPALYDRNHDSHFNLTSALHKSIRGSDPDAALYWFARMIEGGEDPLYIGRRLIRIATEDIGLADPEALHHAMNGWNAYNMLGSPEGELALAQVILYLSLAPKSNAGYLAYREARKIAEESGHLDPPKHIMNAPTKLMEDMGYSKKYEYDPDTPHGFSGQEYFPDEIGRQNFYRPVERGFEREMKKRHAYFAKLRLHIKDQKSDS